MALIVDGIYSLFCVYLCEDICASFVNGRRTSSDLEYKYKLYIRLKLLNYISCSPQTIIGRTKN